jgi:YfiH family protein
MKSDRIDAQWPAPPNVQAGTTLRHADGAELGFAAAPCWLHQVHGSDVVDVRRFVSPPQADASVGRHANDISVVRTADCLPVLFCSDDGETIAAAHAGWRGLAAGVLENTVASMRVAPRHLMAWFGPAIAQPQFEVGAEVRAVFVQQDAAARNCFLPNQSGRWQADLYALARQRLAAVGVTRTYGGDLCTYADAERFYSYRRDPGCGRMTSFITRS